MERTVKIKSGTGIGITKNKQYPILRMVGDNGFITTDDYGYTIVCKIKDCSHLNGGNWEIVNSEENE